MEPVTRLVAPTDQKSLAFDFATTGLMGRIQPAGLLRAELSAIKLCTSAALQNLPDSRFTCACSTMVMGQQPQKAQSTRTLPCVCGIRT